MNLDNKDALALANALQAAGVKLDGLKAVNPWATSDTPRSREIRWMLEAANPALANKLKGDAGHESMVPSLAYAASVAAGTIGVDNSSTTQDPVTGTDSQTNEFA